MGVDVAVVDGVAVGADVAGVAIVAVVAVVDDDGPVPARAAVVI